MLMYKYFNLLTQNIIQNFKIFKIYQKNEINHVTELKVGSIHLKDEYKHHKTCIWRNKVL